MNHQQTPLPDYNSLSNEKVLPGAPTSRRLSDLEKFKGQKQPQDSLPQSRTRAYVRCRHCEKMVWTRVSLESRFGRNIGLFTSARVVTYDIMCQYIEGMICCMLGCLCCFIPCCLFKDYHHYCPECRSLISVVKS